MFLDCVLTLFWDWIFLFQIFWSGLLSNVSFGWASLGFVMFFSLFLVTLACFIFACPYLSYTCAHTHIYIIEWSGNVYHYGKITPHPHLSFINTLTQFFFSSLFPLYFISFNCKHTHTCMHVGHVPMFLMHQIFLLHLFFFFLVINIDDYVFDIVVIDLIIFSKNYNLCCVFLFFFPVTLSVSLFFSIYYL